MGTCAPGSGSALWGVGDTPEGAVSALDVTPIKGHTDRAEILSWAEVDPDEVEEWAEVDVGDLVVAELDRRGAWDEIPSGSDCDEDPARWAVVEADGRWLLASAGDRSGPEAVYHASESEARRAMAGEVAEYRSHAEEAEEQWHEEEEE